MDTKWKKSKTLISFMAFFIGASLVLCSIIGLIQECSGESLPEYLTHALEDDYQQGWWFRSYISDRLETFLAMGTNSMAPDNYYDYYYDYDYYDSYYNYPSTRADAVTENTASLWEGSQEPAELWEGNNWKYYYDDDYLEDYYDDYFGNYYDGYLDDYFGNYYNGYLENYYEDYLENHYGDYLENYYNEHPGEYNNQEYSSLTKEQRKELWEKLREELGREAAQKYHDNIKENENLLYTILYDGKVLYTNSQELVADGSMTAPEGYNFLLYYNDGKVRIVKDGKELDVYGDGYYRDHSQWYVPGYRNFQVDEELNKVTVYMAVAREPILYTSGKYKYGQGSVYRQTDNTLYWMRCQSREARDRMMRIKGSLIAGAVLLLSAFLSRKTKRTADEAIARFTGKIWLECKVLLLFGILYLIFLNYITNSYGYGYNLWQEFLYVSQYEYNTAEVLGTYGGELLKNLPSLFWFIIFWGIYLAVNDIRYNKDVWKHSLFLKLYRKFSARELKLPLSRKMAHRNTALFCTAAVYGLLMLSGAVILILNSRNRVYAAWGAGLLMLALMAVFLLLEYLLCSKNMETARDMQALSDRISDIRSGNYAAKSQDASEESFGKKPGSCSPGHDLDNAMAQLEDIRHGMAIAVDEQMKSERMKVELIANVSHDIKTPLTSIISYVQFLKKEENLPEHVKDYVTILDEKSQRLKNMVQDVFAVSKAASGELPMNMEELDFCRLLQQTMADMEEEIANSNVTFRTEIPDAPVMILADGQRMYRVFQNLFQNAIQYSLNGSRVYVTLKTDGTMAVASVKNTSHMELERGKDFTERFARGDQSRTDGGSGLGLSIAQSFTEACGGQFSLEMDADLFVVTVSFRIL